MPGSRAREGKHPGSAPDPARALPFEPAKAGPWIPIYPGRKRRRPTRMYRHLCRPPLPLPQREIRRGDRDQRHQPTQGVTVLQRRWKNAGVRGAEHEAPADRGSSDRPLVSGRGLEQGKYSYSDAVHRRAGTANVQVRREEFDTGWRDQGQGWSGGNRDDATARSQARDPRHPGDRVRWAIRRPSSTRPGTPIAGFPPSRIGASASCPLSACPAASASG